MTTQSKKKRYVSPYNYTPREVNVKETTNKSIVIPDRSMTVQHILDRFVRNLSVDVRKRDPVYLDQTEMDMEKAARGDFSEQFDLANEMRAKGERGKAAIESAMSERNAKEEQENEQNDAGAKQPAKGQSEDLDNTLPDDTKKKTKKL